MEAWVDISILGLMALTAIAIVMLRNLLAVVMLSGIYSLLAASIFVVMDAVDVAFTEAAVGAGISTMLFIGTLALTTRIEKKPAHTPVLPLIVVIITGAVGSQNVHVLYLFHLMHLIFSQRDESQFAHGEVLNQKSDQNELILQPPHTPRHPCRIRR